MCPGIAQDMSLRLAGCYTVVIIDGLHLLTVVFPTTGQISYIEDSGVVSGPVDWSRIDMSIN